MYDFKNILNIKKSAKYSLVTIQGLQEEIKIVKIELKQLKEKQVKDKNSLDLAYKRRRIQ